MKQKASRHVYIICIICRVIVTAIFTISFDIIKHLDPSKFPKAVTYKPTYILSVYLNISTLLTFLYIAIRGAGAWCLDGYIKCRAVRT